MIRSFPRITVTNRGHRAHLPYNGMRVGSPNDNSFQSGIADLLKTITTGLSCDVPTKPLKSQEKSTSQVKNLE